MKLSEHAFIRSISPERRDTILAEIEILSPREGAIIFEENSYPDALYVLLEGSVIFSKVKPDGSLQNVSQCGEGALFGEVGVFTEERRALRAIAGPDAVLGCVPKASVVKIIEDAEPVRKVLESVIHHLKSTTSHYMEDVMRTEKLTLVGTMVSSLLHDFKNPVSTISLGTDLIKQRHGDDPQTVKVCGMIAAQTRRMVDMANDLAAFARGEEEIERAHIRIEELFKTFKELNSLFFDDESVSVVMEHNNISLYGDATKLLRVLQNLVSNAIEAIHQTELSGEVIVSANVVGERVHLVVRDNGPGIPEEIQTKFFEPFVTYGKSGGTGLGTAIVQSIVDAHSGSIAFSTSSKGTTFTIKLPLQSAE